MEFATETVTPANGERLMADVSDLTDYTVFAVVAPTTATPLPVQEMGNSRF